MRFMSIERGRLSRAIPPAIGVLTVLALVPLLVWDAWPKLFPEQAHETLSAIPLTLIAIAYVVHQGVQHATPQELAKAVMMAGAFLFWAANQYWPHHPASTLFNDIAVALFVSDVFLAIVGWPSRDSAAETRTETGAEQPGAVLALDDPRPARGLGDELGPD
jgi:hypothetical protein